MTMTMTTYHSLPRTPTACAAASASCLVTIIYYYACCCIICCYCCYGNALLQNPSLLSLSHPTSPSSALSTPLFLCHPYKYDRNDFRRRRRSKAMVNARRKYEDELEDQIIGGGSMQIIHEIGVGIDLGTTNSAVAMMVACNDDDDEEGYREKVDIATGWVGIGRKSWLEYLLYHMRWFRLNSHVTSVSFFEWSSNNTS